MDEGGSVGKMVREGGIRHGRAELGEDSRAETTKTRARLDRLAPRARRVNSILYHQRADRFESSSR